ncbi:hypothetical protein [Methylobacterium nodulans]|uniref:Uncharacterized protein n=1 Tax=Methylobacterium nodulans (strain LMG 21967 / CNCM I-2342 / ORS 2060) TaxID=460265 RepID=B8IE47_METNO|nr:hypothetical protein [Methylobacterium nodulans]ACL57593.1 hypothetical protein Mnod_2630 [Methylobacterium nodulans ORS 2060]
MTASLPLARILAAHGVVLALVVAIIATVGVMRPTASHPTHPNGPTRILTEAQP